MKDSRLYLAQILECVDKILTYTAGMLAPGRWIEAKRAMGAALGWRELTDVEWHYTFG